MCVYRTLNIYALDLERLRFRYLGKLCRIIFQAFLLHMQNLPGNLHDMIFKCNLLVYCHQGVTVLWQPNVRPFLSTQFDFECSSSRLTHFTRIELTFFLKLLFFHRFPADVMKEQWSQKQPNNSCLIIFQSKKKNLSKLKYLGKC